jgi:TorA maturation chaperone TorD
MSAIVENPPLAEEDLARAGLYGLLARLLYAAPDAALLAAIVQADEIAAQESALAASWHRLQAASQVMDPEAAQDEYEKLFIGLGQGEVMPYLSWYLTGFLMEEPLAKLRDDLELLGLVKAAEVGEPEDHIAALCEVMRWLVAGDAETPSVALSNQKEFFERHLKPWYARLAATLEQAPSANYYRAVARLLKDFLDIEAQAFEIGN